MEAKSQDRKDTAAFASDRFKTVVAKHNKLYIDQPMTDHELAETAFDSKLAAEAKFGIRISITCDVDGNWWFQ